MVPQILDDIIDYVKQGKTSCSNESLSTYSFELQMSLMLLLSWLKIDRKQFPIKSLRIRSEKSLPQMKYLINNSYDLSFLTIRNGYIKFNPLATQEQIKEIQDYVRTNYRPRFNITLVDEFDMWLESGK